MSFFTTFNVTACELSAFTAGFFAYAQIYTLTCIALERAWATRNTRVQTPSTAQTIIKLSVVWTLRLVYNPFLKEAIFGILFK